MRRLIYSATVSYTHLPGGDAAGQCANVCGGREVPAGRQDGYDGDWQAAECGRVPGFVQALQDVYKRQHLEGEVTDLTASAEYSLWDNVATIPERCV